MKSYLLKAIPHAAAVAIFIILASAFFGPVWDGYDLRQGDYNNWRGMSEEISYYRLTNDKEPLWTDSMFGGMPAYQISVLHHSNYLLPIDKFMKFYLPGPVGVVFMCMLGFYILGLCLRVNPWLSIAGAIAFGFATINMLYLGAGHNSKVNAIAYMAPTIGGLILAYRGHLLRGVGVFTLFLGLNLAANHLQMTYYLAMLLGAIGVAEIARLAIQKEFGTVLKASALLAVGAVVAVLPNMSNILTTYNYSKFTTRGASSLTIKPSGEEKEASEASGLASNYILEYNFGKGEVWSLVIPNAKGGESGQIGKNKELVKLAPKKFQENIAGQNQYWGEQSFTGGAFYFGAVIMALCVLGFIFVKDTIRWPMLVIALLTLLLCQKEMSGANDFFIHHFPMYNKFRDSKMILVLLQIIAPVMAILLMQRLISDETMAARKKFVLAGAGIVAFISIITVAAPNMMGSYLSSEEIAQFDEMSEKAPAEQISMIEEFKEALTDVRLAIYKADAQRSMMFVLCTVALVVVVFMKVIKPSVAFPILILLVLADLWPVNKRYLNDVKEKGVMMSYTKKSDKLVPYTPNKADFFILEQEKQQVNGFDEKSAKLNSAIAAQPAYADYRDKETMKALADFGTLYLNSDFRVLNLGNPFSDGRTSFFHKSIGGYHGAKLKRYQELIDFHLNPEMRTLIDSLQTTRSINVLAQLPAINMLNAQYIIFNGDAPPIENENACGNAWFVKNVNVVENDDAEILAIGNLDVKNSAVANKEFASLVKTQANVDSTASITLTEYGTNILRYKSTSNDAATAVFSEIYYSDGWVCRVDGNEVPTYRVNYVLRGATIPAGEHNIEWSFEPAGFFKSEKISLAGSWVLILLLLGTAVVEVKQLRQEGN
jgi:hypothetical protein